MSYDSGRSWNWYVVDTSAFEANGNFLEVSREPLLRSLIHGRFLLPCRNASRREYIGVTTLWMTRVGAKRRVNLRCLGADAAVNAVLRLDSYLTIKMLCGWL